MVALLGSTNDIADDFGDFFTANSTASHNVCCLAVYQTCQCNVCSLGALSIILFLFYLNCLTEQVSDSMLMSSKSRVALYCKSV